MSRGISMGATRTVATFELAGDTCDIIRFGCRLRIVSQKKDRSIDNRGYIDLEAIMKAYPAETVRNN